MVIIICPFSQQLKDKENPKNYPYWEELIELLSEHELWQIGRSSEPELKGVKHFFKDLPFSELIALLKKADLYISVDSFFPHLAHHYKKRGIVLFSRSNPEIFGYPENINLYSDSKYFRADQFGLWESCEFIKEAFVSPEKVKEAVDHF